LYQASKGEKKNVRALLPSSCVRRMRRGDREKEKTSTLLLPCHGDPKERKKEENYQARLTIFWELTESKGRKRLPRKRGKGRGLLIISILPGVGEREGKGKKRSAHTICQEKRNGRVYLSQPSFLEGRGRVKKYDTDPKP